MKDVKIIGLRVNQKFGILESCQLKFDPKDNLIAVKGGVGQGKSTLQKALRLGVQGQNTLKDDKTLYGHVEQEVELLDGGQKIYIGCKSDSGTLKYVLYCKDDKGNKISDPIIDGVKATPSTYLKSMQTALTWKMNDLTSENQTIQKKILLELYQPELEKVGVIFDKTSSKYSESILGRLDLEISIRTECDILRKRVGGLVGDLKQQGYDIENSDTLPKRVDVKSIQKEISLKEYELENINEAACSKKEDILSKIKSEASNLTSELKEYNLDCQQENNILKDRYKKDLESFCDITSKISEFESISRELTILGVLTISEVFCDHPTKPTKPNYLPLIPFEGSMVQDIDDVNIFPSHIIKKISLLDNLRSDYITKLSEKTEVSTTELELNLLRLRKNLSNSEDINKICDAVDAFNEWQESDMKVRQLREEYVALLAGVNTGVQGLKIVFEENDEKMNVYLSYNGCYDKVYFNNPDLEYRKLGSYSGTQKPMIALLVQDYLLSRKEKTMRCIWIDDVPIDKKTQELLGEMAEELNLTVFVNITGDFDKNTLIDGEILVENGHLFFN